MAQVKPGKSVKLATRFMRIELPYIYIYINQLIVEGQIEKEVILKNEKKTIRVDSS